MPDHTVPRSDVEALQAAEYVEYYFDIPHKHHLLDRDRPLKATQVAQLITDIINIETMMKHGDAYAHAFPGLRTPSAGSWAELATQLRREAVSALARDR